MRIDNLKIVFTEIAGEDKIIDRDEFKNALNIADKNISNRLFDLFDEDKSGTLELDEFLNTVNYLQDADENQKLKFAFDLYDIDGSGTIEENELTELIKSGLNENKLNFSDDQVNDLSHLLFTEVDTDDSGEISFDEFQEIAKKYPDLLTGMSVSPVAWLKPKEETVKQKPKKQNSLVKKSTDIIKKIDKKTFLFYSVFLLINIGLFINAFLTYRELGVNIYVQIARGFGATLNFNGAIILLPMMRNFITKFRKTQLYNFIPLDDAVTFHRFVGHLMFFSGLFHTIAHFFNYTTLPNSFISYLFYTQAGLTGVLITIVFTAMWTTALPSIRKGGYFKLFYIAHMGYILWLIILLLHGPRFWKWLLIPGVLFIYERFKRSRSLVHETTVYDVSLLPSSVLGLFMNKPNTFKYQAGDYLYIKCPSISNFEWHPFTISSAPEDDEIVSLHIRAVGSWTGNLLNYYKDLRNESNPGVKVNLPVLIDGPYGTPSDKVFNAEIAILVATGIGVTPYSSILKSLLHRIYVNKEPNLPKKIYFYWQNRGQNSFEWFVDLLSKIEEKDIDKRFDLNIFLTGTQSQKDMKSSMLFIAMDMKHKKTNVDLITGLKVKTNFGRPNWKDIFTDISKVHPNEKTEIFFCGHPAVGKQLEIEGNKVNFKFHKENF